MPTRILSYLHKEFTGLHEAALLLAGSAFLSQILALLRDRLLASTFGSGTSLDIYYAAFKIPDFLFASIASFVSVTVLIPFIIERLEGDRTDEARAFMNSVFTVFFAVMVVVCAVTWLAIPLLAPLVVPGFTPAAQADFIMLSRILLLSPLLLGFSNLLGSVTQSFRKFFIYALTPIVYNVGIILGIVVFYPIFGLSGLVYGVVLGAVLHVGIQLPTLLQLKFFPKFTSSIDWRALKSVVLTSLPRTLALATDKISLIVLASLGSLMAAGSITIFNLALNLQSVPFAVIGVSYSIAAFPALAQIFKKGDMVEFREKVETALRHIIFWSLPATVLFIVLRAQIIRVLYGAGRFTWSDTRLTAAALALFALSVVAQSLILLFVRAYYAGGRTMRPLVVNAGTSILTIIFAFVFINWFDNMPLFRNTLENILRVPDVYNTNVLTLPLAYSLGYIINAVLLWYYFLKDFGSFASPVVRSSVEVLCASVVGGLATYLALNASQGFLTLHTTLGVFTQGFVSGIIGILVIMGILRVLKNKELATVTSTLHHKLWSGKTVIGEQNV